MITRRNIPAAIQSKYITPMGQKPSEVKVDTGLISKV